MRLFNNQTERISRVLFCCYVSYPATVTIWCGISSQLRQTVPGFDEVLQPNADNRLRVTLVIRLSNLIAIPALDIDRAIGYIPDALHRDLLRLADYLTIL